MMILIKKALTRLPALFMIVVMAVTFVPFAFAAEPVEVLAPGGDEEYTFSMRIQVSEETPFAGMQFSLEVSDPEALELDSYKMAGGDITDAIEVAPVLKNGVYTFGFTTGHNAFSGDLDVGEITLTYHGTEAASFTITEANFVHFPNDGNTSAWLREDKDFVTVNISRVDSGTNAGPGASGGAGTLSILDALVPLQTGAGSEFGWALLNLLFAIAAVTLMVVTGVRMLRARAREKGKTTDEPQETRSEKRINKKNKRNSTILKIVSLVFGAALVALFLLTQDMGKLMVYLDQWSIVSALIFAAELTTYLLAFKRKKSSAPDKKAKAKDSDDSGDGNAVEGDDSGDADAGDSGDADEDDAGDADKNS